MMFAPFVQGGAPSPISPTSLTLTGVGAFIVFKVVQRVARMMEDEEQRQANVMVELQSEREERKQETGELRGQLEAERMRTSDLQSKWLVCEAHREQQQEQITSLAERLARLEQREGGTSE